MSFYDGKRLEFSYCCSYCKRKIDLVYVFSQHINSSLNVTVRSSKDTFEYVNRLNILEEDIKNNRVKARIYFNCKECGQDTVFDAYIGLKDNKLFIIEEC